MNRFTIILLLAARCAWAGQPSGTIIEQVNTGPTTQQIEGQRVFHSGTSMPDSPIVGFAENGASAAVFTQSLHFTSPVFTVSRTGTAGCTPASTAVFNVSVSNETTGTTPVMLLGGCAVTSGDNYIISWGDSSLAMRTGIRAYRNNQVQGPLAIDPNFLQLLREDGVTPQLQWSGSQVQITGPLTVSGLGTSPSITVNGPLTASAITVNGPLTTYGMATFPWLSLSTGTSTPPANRTTPVAWRDIVISGVTYKLPLYQ